MRDRKKEHIELAFQSQTSRDLIDNRFYYEPMLSSHPVGGLNPVSFLGKTFGAPLWVSSITGGTEEALTINHNLATVCREFGFGMGLGSCRSLLYDNQHFADFDMRDVLGEELPLFANLGICQVEQLLENNQAGRITALVEQLRANGLIVHVNPLQEWFQPEGDMIKNPPIDTVKRLLDKVQIPVIVKEVGQGMGPESLRELMKLPLEAIEFAAFGGTNFAAIERLRGSRAAVQLLEPFSKVGMDAFEMMDIVNRVFEEERNVRCRQLIISGGINTYLDGYYLLQKSPLPAVYGQAWAFLKYAREDYSQLREYVAGQIKGLAMAQAFLRIRS